MSMRLITLGLFAAMLGSTLLGCSAPRQKRPVAGDKVSVAIVLSKKAWQQNGFVLLSTRLLVQGEKDAEPSMLQLEDVPHELVPHATLVFYEGKKELSRLKDIALTRDC